MHRSTSCVLNLALSLFWANLPNMPAPLNVDREAVKTLAIAVGVREAARQLSIPEPTVQSWSLRGNWFAKPALPPTMLRPASGASISPSRALSDTLADDSKRTRLGFAKAARKAAEHLAEADADTILKRSKSMLDAAKTAATVHGWAGNQQAAGGIHIGVLTGQVAIQYTSQD